MAGRKKQYITQGWVSVHRKLANSPFWLSEKFTAPQAWIDLIMLAQHKDSFLVVRGAQVRLYRGQVGYSMTTLGNRWDWSVGKVKRFLSRLENDGMVKQHNDNVTTIVTIVNYELYQSNETQTERKQNASSLQTEPNNNDNKKNNVNRREETFAPPTLNEVVSLFLELGSTGNEAELFMNHYTANGWMMNQTPMKNWKAAVKSWLSRVPKFKTNSNKSLKNIKHASDF